MKPIIGITSSLGGWKAIMYDADGPIETGIGAYGTEAMAAAEALDWAESESLCVDDSVEPYIGKVGHL